ncbi:hypothetical protein ES705_25140 [subsurface metagenome]
MSNSFNISLKAVLDAIKLKTDGIQQNVRGKSSYASLATDSYPMIEVVNVYGHGKIYMMSIQLEVPTDEIHFDIALDDTLTFTGTFTGDTDVHPIVLYPEPTSGNPQFQTINETDVRNKLLNLEFATNLRFRISRYSGTGYIFAEIFYALDPF